MFVKWSHEAWAFKSSASLHSEFVYVQGFYDPPAALTNIQFQTADFDALLQTTPNSTLDRARAFPVGGNSKTVCLLLQCTAAAQVNIHGFFRRRERTDEQVCPCPSQAMTTDCAVKPYPVSATQISIRCNRQCK